MGQEPDPQQEVVLDLQSLGIDPKKKNELNDRAELADLADTIKQAMYDDYKTAYGEKVDHQPVSRCELYIPFLFIESVIQKARCGHSAPASFAEAHGGLCRKCHSNFVFIVDMEKKYGEDALVEYWYSVILTRLPETMEEVRCFVSHLVEFYEAKLAERPSKRSYVEKMLYMLRSVQDPFDNEGMK